MPGSWDDTTLLERKTLGNKTLAITRKSIDAKEFLDLVTSAGGRAIALPTIEIVPSQGSIKNALSTILVNDYDICIFMSPKAVEVICEYATECDKIENMVSVLNSKIVVAQGPVTKKTLERYGILVRLVPGEFSSEGVVSLFQGLDIAERKKVIIPRSSMANDFITRSLTDLGLDVLELSLYSTKTASPDKKWKEFMFLLKKKRIDAIIFTSASSVNSFFEILHSFYSNYDQFLQPGMIIISIGPLTTKELAAKNISCLESSEHTIRGTFELAKSVLNGRREIR